MCFDFKRRDILSFGTLQNEENSFPKKRRFKGHFEEDFYKKTLIGKKKSNLNIWRDVESHISQGFFSKKAKKDIFLLKNLLKHFSKGFFWKRDIFESSKLQMSHQQMIETKQKFRKCPFYKISLLKIWWHQLTNLPNQHDIPKHKK